MAQARWDTRDMPDLTGKVAVVSGANSGLGLHTASALAAKGAHVVMACRDGGKAGSAMAQIRGETPKAGLEFLPLNLASLASVKRFGEAFAGRHKRLDILCNNAGVMFAPRGTTEDGFETHFGTNHLGHFALTGALMEPLMATPGARVVTVASEFARLGAIALDDLNGEKRFSRMAAYANAKLANLIFALELQRRLEAKGASLISAAAHPGYSATNLQAAGVQMGEPDALARFGDWSMKLLNRSIAQSAAMGALPTLRAATAPDVKGGDYYGPELFFGQRGYPVRAGRPPQANNLRVAKRLWEISEDMTGATFP